MQSMLARLRGMVNSMKSDDAPKTQGPPVASTIEAPAPSTGASTAAPPAAPPVAKAAEPPAAAAATATAAPPAAPVATGPTVCPVCRSPREGMAEYCGDCGFLFSGDTGSTGAALTAAAPPPAVIKNRYQVLEFLGDRGGVARYRGSGQRHRRRSGHRRASRLARHRRAHRRRR